MNAVGSRDCCENVSLLMDSGVGKVLNLVKMLSQNQVLDAGVYPQALKCTKREHFVSHRLHLDFDTVLHSYCII